MAHKAPLSGGRGQPVSPGWVVTLFSHAFRPFFLAAGAYAALALAAWLAWIAIHAAGAMPTFMTIAEPPYLWHAHEMVFGFGAAAVGGFLLTAVPNWTGARPSQGAGLVVMFALWLAGRIAMWATGLLPAAAPTVLDLAFLPVLGLAAARQLAVQPALRNAVFLALILLFVAGNLQFHLGRLGALDGGMRAGVLTGLATLVVMIVVIGGRVTPGFTRNALLRRGIEDRLPRRIPVLNAACLVLAAGAFVLHAAGAPDRLTGLAALAAALANGARLALWRPLATLGEPILWVLHVGYAWIAIGFALLASVLLGGWTSEAAAFHAFGTGAVGTMILAIMSRASLGHTGRPLVAWRPIVVAYLLVTAAALLRSFGPALAPGLYNEVMLSAGLAWIAAFSLFTAVFAPVLLRPRLGREDRE